MGYQTCSWGVGNKFNVKRNRVKKPIYLKHRYYVIVEQRICAEHLKRELLSNCYQGDLICEPGV